MKTPLVGIIGRAGSGKDTVATMMPAIRIAFADPMKEALVTIFDWERILLWGPSELRNTVDDRFVTPDGQPLTVRHAAQTIGTEWGRRLIDEQLWVKLGIIRAQQEMDRLNRVVITDVRFLNEAKAIQDAGGEVWRVVRPGAGLTGAAALHPSEIEQDQIRADFEIQNNGTLEELKDKVLWACDSRGFL